MSSISGHTRHRVGLALLLLIMLALVACAGDDALDSTPTTDSMAQQPATAEPTSPPAETDAAATSAPETTASRLEPTPTVAQVEPSATSAETAADQTPEPEDTPTPDMVESQVSQVSLAQVAAGFTRPLHLTHAFDERLFVVEQQGRVKIIDGDQVLAQPFLDITDRVGSAALEQGLLSIAFHPQYKENGRFFIDYTDLQGDTVVAGYQVDPSDANRADIDSEQILLRIDQPYGNHNGGQLQFGPDGYLYVGMGDGGSAGDPLNNGQDPSTLLGALLRLDVDGTDPDGQLAYAIPDDNPFVGIDGAREEIWAYGLRNPWRFSFDRQTGDLFLSDVGQNLWEEVNFRAAGSAGGADFGWNVMEASTCFNSMECDSSSFVMPVAEYPHQDGNCSITGGYIYRGTAFPALAGNYFFADYCTGTIWSLFGGPDGPWQTRQLQRTGMFIPSFGEDRNGELYVIDQVNGDIYQLQS